MDCMDVALPDSQTRPFDVDVVGHIAVGATCEPFPGSPEHTPNLPFELPARPCSPAFFHKPGLFRKRKADALPSSSDLGTTNETARLKQQKFAELYAGIPFDRRQLRIKFGQMRKTFCGRQICKEPWGLMVQLAERCVTDTDTTLERGSLVWCRNWDGQMDEFSVAVVEAMYTC